MRDRSGDVVGGKYRIGRLIGDGGMGTVYEAKHEVLGTAVALKFLHPELAKRPGLVARFLREAQVSARIQSPHVTRVTDVEQSPDGSAFIVMELLSGESLQEVLDRERKLAVPRAVDHALQILAGLEAAHALSVVHRDLKPDNVFVSPSHGGPLLRLLDFGIAKVRESTEYKKGLTRPGALMGTPEYMAPEQAFAADQVDHRADLYSVGAMLYEMLSGDRPAYGDDARAIAEAVMAGRVRRLESLAPDVPPGLAEVVHRAMDPVPARRFGSAHEMRQALAPHATELSHAGRLAASTAPLAERGTPPPVASTPPTLDDAPALGTAAPRSASTPPTAPDAAPITAPSVISAASGTAVGPVLAHGAHVMSHGAPGIAPWGAPGAPPLPQGRGVGALVALLLGVVVAGGVIALVVTQRSPSADDPPALFTSAPPTTLTSQGPPAVAPDLPAADPPPRPSPDPPRTSPGPRPGLPAPGPGPAPKADAGAAPPRPQPDAGRTPIPPGIPLPPGFASALPPGIPTTIPTFFPIPGFGVPPAPSPLPAPAPAP